MIFRLSIASLVCFQMDARIRKSRVLCRVIDICRKESEVGENDKP